MLLAGVTNSEQETHATQSNCDIIIQFQNLNLHYTHIFHVKIVEQLMMCNTIVGIQSQYIVLNHVDLNPCRVKSLHITILASMDKLVKLFFL